MALTKVSSGLISADASSVDLNIDAGTLYIDATNNNVGIGTTSPVNLLGQTSLTINGNVARVDLQVSQTTAGSVVSESGYIHLQPATGGKAIVGNGGTDLVVDSSGNVGIGTSNPSVKLHVVHDSAEFTTSLLDTTTKATLHLKTHSEDSTITSFGGVSGGGAYIQRSNGAGTAAYGLLLNPYGGNVGIGTSSPATKLHVTGTVGAFHSNNDNRILMYNNGTVGSISVTYGTTGPYLPLTFLTSDTERMRITSNGEFLLNRTGIFGTGNTCSAFIQGKSTAAMYVIGTNTSGYQLITFFNGGLSVMGSITHNNTSVTYGTSSDYRLKENVVELDGAIDRVKLLQPKRFNFIADAENTVDGFLAHEVADVVPEAITGVKDEMQEEEYEVTPAVLDEDGNVVTEAVMGTREVPKYQNIDQSKLVPLLTKAIQELSNKVDNQQVLIEQLQAEVALLKGE